MITLINKELFSTETSPATSDKGDYFKTVISSAVEVKNQKTKESQKRIVTIVNSEFENYNDANTSVKTKTNAVGKLNVSISSSQKNITDNHIFLIAIPFNGIIYPIENSFDFRMYKAFILKSEKRTIEFNGETYKKIAYMVVLPNESLFNEENKHHKDVLSIKMESVNIESNGDSKKTLKTTTTISISKDREPIVETVSEEIDPVDPATFRNKNIFPIYKAKKKGNPNAGAKKSGKNIETMIDEFNKKSGPDHEKNFSKKNRKSKH